MRFAAILREASRNLRSGTARAMSAAALFLTLACGLAVLDLMSIQSIQDDAHAFQESGASIVTLEAPGQIDGAACEALTGIGTIRSSGALRNTDPVRFAVLPDGAVPAFDVTPGVLSVLGANPSGAGIAISDQVSDVTGADDGEQIATANGRTARVTAVYAYPSDGRRSGFGYAILSPTAVDDPFDECWVEAWPTSPQTTAILRPALIPSEDGTQGTYSQLNGTLGAHFDGTAMFNDRITRFAPVLAFTLGAALAALLVHRRRLSHSSALHAGARHSDLLSIWAVETACWITPGVAATLVAAGIFIVRGPDADSSAVFASVLGILAAALAGVILGGALAHTAVKERHLFRYFADR